MNILVLGGNGYLGSKVVHMLLQEGHELVCTKRQKSDLSRVRDIADEVVWIPASMDAIEVSIIYNSFDWVINMASNYGRDNLLYDHVLEANIEFPLMVLNKCVESGVTNFVTIGTCLPENLNMYSFSKNMFSSFGKFYEDKHHINFFNLQLEMFYGADEPRDRFLPSVIDKMIDGKDVCTTLGTQHRDIISIDDIVKAIHMIMHSNLEGYKDIQVGTGIAPTISEMVDFIWENTGCQSAVHKGAIEMRRDEPDCVADTSVLQSIGEWNPMFWKDGISFMINKMKMERKN